MSDDLVTAERLTRHIVENLGALVPPARRARLLRFGCWLNGHALIRRVPHEHTTVCRCGRRWLSDQALRSRMVP